MQKTHGLDYDAWKLFIDAAELGSLSKVAAAYGNSQPHVSRQISELEQQCGGRLFQRTGRGVVLTELGQRVAPKVRLWLASTAQLASDIQSTAGQPIGGVRIGILPSTAHPLVSNLYYRLKQVAPMVQLSIREGQGSQLEHWLETGAVDLAILYRHNATPKDGDLYLAETSTYLVGARGDSLTAHATVPFAALHHLPLAMFCRPNSWRDRLDQLSVEHGVALNVVVEADSLSLQTSIVGDGGVYAILGPYAIASAHSRSKLQASRIVDPAMRRFVALAMSPHGELTLACKTVMHEVVAIARAGADLQEPELGLQPAANVRG